MTDGSAFRVPMAFLVVLFFAVGLVVSFWVAGIFGMAPPIFWPAVVIFFLIGVLFLAKPKGYLVFLFVYYGFFAGGSVLGHFHVRIPFVQVLDEILLAVPLAIIVMKAVGRSLPGRVTYFPAAFLILCFMSYKMNDVPALMAFRGTLSYFKFFIYWYFARCVGPWSEKERRRLTWGLVAFGLIQFFLNVYWQRGLTQRNPDIGSGSIGGAHHVAYISVYCLFILAAFFVYRRRQLSLFQYALLCVAGLILGYNSIIFTDAKHVLFLLPIAALPIFVSPGVSNQMRLLFTSVGLLIAVPGFIYVQRASEYFGGLQAYWYSFVYSGRSRVWSSLIHLLPRDVPVFYLFGAGPNNVCSSAAVYGLRPLGARYVLPYVIHGLRMRGDSAESSVVGSVFSSAAVLWAEYGPITMALYYGFWIYIAYQLWRRSAADKTGSFDSAVMLALSSCLILILLLSGLSESFIVPILVVPVWSLIGAFWDPSEPVRAPEPQVRMCRKVMPDGI